MTMTTKDHLEKIENNLARIVGVQKVQEMNAVQFITYAHGEMTKAIQEDATASSKRLKALHTSVKVFKDNYTDDDSESIKVPVYVCEQTALQDKSTKLTQITAAAGLNPGGESVFEDGFIAKMAALKTQIEELAKAAGDDEEPPPSEPEEEEEEDEEGDGEAKAKAKKAEDEEAEKAKKKPAFLKPPAGDGAKDEDKAKKAAPDIEEGDDAVKAKKKIDKSITPDVSADGTVWPTDLNSTTEKQLEWGRDR